MNIFVTGAFGFLGQHLCRQLRDDDHHIIEVSSESADLRKSGTLESFTSQRFDRIYHLAAWTQAGDENGSINQAINSNVLDWWRRHQSQAKLIAIGTSCAYPPGLPHVENNYLKGDPVGANRVYAISKQKMLNSLERSHREDGLTYLHLVAPTLIGRYYRKTRNRHPFIFDLFQKIMSGKENGRSVTFWGDGEQRREVMSATDFAVIAKSLDEKIENQTVNIGSGFDHSIREFVELICQLADFDRERIRFDGRPDAGPRSRCLDVSLMRSLLPIDELAPLEVGLKETYDWLLRKDPS